MGKNNCRWTKKPRRLPRLEHAFFGCAARTLSAGSSSHLAGFRPAASSPGSLHSFEGPDFIDKVRDVVGLYRNPPENALVLSVDEKSQIQALERSQPILPMRPGRPQRWSHDYYRHGTTSLFAALDVATGRIIGATKSRHRSQEFLSFLRQIEREVACDFDVYLILDNYATHKTAEVARWLKQTSLASSLHSNPLKLVKPGRALLCSDNEPTYSSRLLSSVGIAPAITDYLAHHNANPKPFRWTASPVDDLLSNWAYMVMTSLAWNLKAWLNPWFDGIRIGKANYAG